MNRTRKWAYVHQEAERLAGLGLSASEIARRLHLNKSTVTRWMLAGKLPSTKASKPQRSARGPVRWREVKSPDDWAKAVRAEYSLDVTDEQLVEAGRVALTLWQDRTQKTSDRLTALRTYQGIVKQLALVARNQQDEAPKDEPKAAAPAPRAPRPVAADPRLKLMISNP